MPKPSAEHPSVLVLGGREGSVSRGVGERDDIGGLAGHHRWGAVLQTAGPVRSPARSWPTCRRVGRPARDPVVAWCSESSAARRVGSGRGALRLASLAPAGRAASGAGCMFSRARRLVAAFGVDLGDVEDGDAATAEPDQSSFGVVVKHLGGGLAGCAGQGRDLFVGERDDR